MTFDKIAVFKNTGRVDVFNLKTFLLCLRAL
jgi:hypothetical protein